MFGRGKHGFVEVGSGFERSFLERKLLKLEGVIRLSLFVYITE